MTINLEHIGYIVGVLAVIYGLYQKIRSDCIKKAIESVAKAEKQTNLSGKERYNFALGNLEKELPGTFIRSLIRNVLGELIQHAYDNSKEFAEGYAKVKTGESIEDIVNKLSSEDESSPEDTISDEPEE
jgi:hypothetical protein